MKTFERPESENLTWLAWRDPAWPAQAQPQPELQDFNFQKEIFFRGWGGDGSAGREPGPTHPHLTSG